jgi:uncharacterized DUF497 family protein
MQFEWDPEKEKMNIKLHGISFSTAKFVFNDSERWERYDSRHSENEDRWQALGLVDRVLFVVYTERGEYTRLISARTADLEERRIYHGGGTGNSDGWTRAY